jgi:hypothetical protein
VAFTNGLGGEQEVSWGKARVSLTVGRHGEGDRQQEEEEEEEDEGSV